MPAAGSGNSRNGHTSKTVQSQLGPVSLDIPRDRQSSFEPALVLKGERRLRGLDNMIISLCLQDDHRWGRRANWAQDERVQVGLHLPQRATASASA